jgi:hypothetical protein
MKVVRKRRRRHRHILDRGQLTADRAACPWRRVRGPQRTGDEDSGCVRRGGSFSEFYRWISRTTLCCWAMTGPAISASRGNLCSGRWECFTASRKSSVEMKVKNGPVTILSVVQTPAETEAPRSGGMCAGPGKSATNSRYRFPAGAGVRERMEQGRTSPPLRNRHRPRRIPGQEARGVAQRGVRGSTIAGLRKGIRQSA